MNCFGFEPNVADRTLLRHTATFSSIEPGYPASVWSLECLEGRLLLVSSVFPPRRQFLLTPRFQAFDVENYGFARRIRFIVDHLAAFTQNHSG